MRFLQLLVHCFLLATFYTDVDGFEPITTVFGLSMVTIAGVSFLGRPIYCTMKECCQDRWIKPELPRLREDLEKSVYGQHLAIDSVVKTLKAHLRYSPPNALVFSFHGWTGTGKNLVAKIIAENMYEKGLESDYVHVLSATKHFARHELTADYKDQIRDWIVGNVTACPRQLFIFDEIEKMPDGVLDILKPFVDHYSSIGGVDYRKSVFIFLGNAGGKALFDKTYEHYLSGKNRDDLQLYDIESILLKEAYNYKGGLKVSSLITSHLISHYIPFLPLEKRHVRQCILDELTAKTVASIKSQDIDNLVEKVMKQLSFTPPNVQLYSNSGCKVVNAKTNLVLDEYFD